jgi:DNA-binding NarL/FixJ family response regulator
MLSGQRLLIIEDSYLIAVDIQRIIEENHAVDCVLLRDYAEAEIHADRFGTFSLAIVNPPGPSAREHEIATALAAACEAIVVSTAAPQTLDGTPLAGAEIVMKPFSDEALLAACRRALALGDTV